MVHLDAAYNLARWLTRDDRDAEDLVQEACTRALRFLDTFRGGNSRAWFLAIVRNTYYSDRKKNRSQSLNVSFDEDSLEDERDAEPAWLGSESGDPVRELEREQAKRLLRDALEELPEEYREVIVLRELEELSYQEIARTMQIPIGTVMSRLSRARKMLYRAILQVQQET
jgi:RNA polymerase sigma-70 factor (ECF subfamily)